MKYTVKKLKTLDWSQIEKAEISIYPWGCSYRPEAYAQLCIVEGEGLHIKMSCKEENPKAVYTEFYDEVWLDSTMEFFFGIKDGDYINCEMNSIGTSLIGVCDGRDGRRRIDEYCDIPKVTAEKKDGWWSVSTLFTYEMIEKVFGKNILEEGFVGNLYKVGEHTASPHYGMWAPIDWEKPDFHRPEFFGNFVIGE